MAKYNGNCVHELISKYGYPPDGFFSETVACMFTNGEFTDTASSVLFGKIPETEAWCLGDFLLQLKMSKMSYKLIVDEGLLVTIKSVRRIYDRGKMFDSVKGCTFSASAYESCANTITSWETDLIGSLLKYVYNGDSVCKLIQEPGYRLDMLFESSDVFVFFGNGESHNACKLFDMMLQQVIGVDIANALGQLGRKLENIVWSWTGCDDNILLQLQIGLHNAMGVILGELLKEDAIQNGHGKVLRIHLEEFKYLLMLLSVSIKVRSHFCLTRKEFFWLSLLLLEKILKRIFHSNWISLDTPYYAPYATSYYNQWIGLYKIEFIWLREYSCIDFVFARLVGILFTTVALRLVVCLRRKLPATYDAQFYCFLVRVLEQGWILNISTPRPFLIEVSASTSLIVPTCSEELY
ncbi:uncharacterized protein LOC113347914 isoform X1 [Papaver somniferum]|uniref:uncharacterized protein LOC113347914 isoform X1 n=1 Tax=Papaver somniferum TaxID=3469 RepID=UPI000E70123A|nr:uncharacterized protein LOC113347914 isoform X1 [Papaver somniferum]XP_026447389.1 uncharacterized protein LOC113347914 isoform X1 [Papaver somniferum]XP_026447390.1 uncharacterized protein LOC113347914 isoform X1 [Papaver somniferum]